MKDLVNDGFARVVKPYIDNQNESVKAQNKSTQQMLATVEEDETDASRAYEVGEQLILDGILYNVIDSIAQHGIITAEGAGANIEVADPITEQIGDQASLIQTLTSQVDGISDEIADMNNILGAKNLLPNNAVSQTINGVTFTVNDDGSITANGTATGSSASIFFAYAKDFLTDGIEYIASYGTWEYDSHMYMYINGVGRIDSSNGKRFTFDSTAHSSGSMYIRINENYTANNLTFYPMIRLASDPDDTYVPYAKTNRELTEGKLEISDIKTIAAASTDFNDFKTRIAAL